MLIWADVYGHDLPRARSPPHSSCRLELAETSPVDSAVQRAVKREHPTEVQRPRLQSCWRVEALRQVRERLSPPPPTWRRRRLHALRLLAFSALQQHHHPQQEQCAQCACTELLRHAQPRGGVLRKP